MFGVLFTRDSRKGKIVLVECPDTGSRYTVKDYESTKTQHEEGWCHQVIGLNPRSYEKAFEPLELTEDQALHYRVIGEFVQVIG